MAIFSPFSLILIIINAVFLMRVPLPELKRLNSSVLKMVVMDIRTRVLGGWYTSAGQ